ncbi:MAG: MMPL family transporter [Pseudomonadota bacterium]
MSGERQGERVTGGTWIERGIFNTRLLIVALFAAVTAVLAWQASGLRTDAAFEKLVPTEHPYIQNFLKHRDALGGLSNVVRVVVVAKDGDILDKDYLETLRRITDEVFYIKGVDRGNLRSLWTPNMRWMAVTADGFDGGLVIPDDYDGSPETIAAVKANILRSNQVGIIVANDFKSTVIQAPLVSADPETGAPLDYAALGRALEEQIRDKYSSDKIGIHITGFAKLVSDLIEGAVVIAVFFAAAVAIMATLLFLYTRCITSTLLAALCSGVAVVWQLGLLTALGMSLDPYSVLVPFLIFAIATSHAIQIINATILNRAAGYDRKSSARLAFRSLARPGSIALLSDSIGFLTLIVIPIVVISDLAISASLGVAMVLLANLTLLPVLLSYVGVSPRAASRAVRAALTSIDDAAPADPEARPGPGGFAPPKMPLIWRMVTSCARRGPATAVILVAVALAAAGAYKSGDLQIGDLDAGAPELRPDSRYNRDVAYLTANYATSTDVLVVMTETPAGRCLDYDTLALMARLQDRLENAPGVQRAVSVADFAQLGLQGFNEGNIKWRALTRNKLTANATLSRMPSGFINTDCSMAVMVVFLEDHKAATLIRATGVVEDFMAEEATGELVFALAAGNAGVEAATNEVIAEAQYTILALVYGVVALLVLATFRSVTALVVILTPLALTSLLGQALMATLGMGVKVATLPVIALGVGIGVDYGIYVYDRLRHYLDQGFELVEAYARAVLATGKAVAFTGFALAAGVATWIFAPTKFQADMGLMLTFMFLWNMIGALTLLPALARMMGHGARAPAARAAPAPAE